MHVLANLTMSIACPSAACMYDNTEFDSTLFWTVSLHFVVVTPVIETPILYIYIIIYMLEQHACPLINSLARDIRTRIKYQSI